MSGAINFAYYPSSNRVPGVYAEIDSSQANTGSLNQRALIIGQMTAAGLAKPNVPVLSAGTGDAITAFGAGSMAALMVAQYRKSDQFGELWVLPLSDASGSVAASGTINVAGTATNAGVVALYIAGTLISTAVTVGATSASVASQIMANIQITPNLPVTVTSGAPSTITVTAINAGAAGNDIDLRVNYLASAGGEQTPAGLTVSFTGTASGNGTLLTGGATNPVLTTALGNLGDQPFDFIAVPYTDTASLNAMQAFFSDVSGRWSWEQLLFGGGFSAYRGSYAALGTFGTGRNDQHMNIMGFYDSPTPSWLWAVDYCANAAISLRADPALPLGGLNGDGVVLNVLAPPVENRFGISEQNTLLYDGISTFVVDQGGLVHISRSVTTYQTSGNGLPDNSYLDTTTPYLLQFLIRDMIGYLASLFSRKVLVADGTRIPVGSNMITSQTVLGAAITRAYYQASQGLLQNPAAFAQAARATNAGNGQVSLLLPWNLAQQLNDIVMLVQFSKT